MRDHDLIPFINNEAISKNQIVEIVPQIIEPTKLDKVLPAKTGAIIPAENQATAPLVKNSANDFLWPTESFFIHFNINDYKQPCQERLYSLNHSSKTFLTIGAATREPSPPASTRTVTTIWGSSTGAKAVNQA